MSPRSSRAAQRSPRDVRALRARLLRWYRRHARALPWRATRDPWAIWVSEVMLQQTQVATALPFYQSFLARFPTPDALARARERDVLAAWAGLGYYRRARHLQQAAQLVVREHDGRVPDDPAKFGALPGVGRYTTGAVLSIAFDRPLPVLDGNVARVLSRLDALPASVREPRGAVRLWAVATSLVPMRGAGDWNQALMELGARVCTPRAPRCADCPVRADCRALALGRVEEFPPVPPRRAPLRVHRALAVIARADRLLMTRRTSRLLEGLWEPPGIDVAAGSDTRAALVAELARLGVKATPEPSGERVRHLLTHRTLEIEVWRATSRGSVRRSTAVRWIDPAKPGVPLTSLAKKVAALRRDR